MIFLSILILIVAKALPSCNVNLSPVLFSRISAIIFIYAGVLSYNTLYIQSIGSGIGIYSGLFHVTNISQYMEIFLLIIGSLILVAWPLIKINPSITEENPITRNNQLLFYRSQYNTEYSLIVLFSTLGSILLLSSPDIVSMYLSIELQSFGLYILATLFRDSESATSAGLKYFLLGGLSSCIILLGAGLIYSYTGLTNFEAIYSLISVSEFNYVLLGLSLGIILILIGFLFKIAAAPLHNWSPDVYNDSPTIVTIWLTIMPKIAILILLLELHTQISNSFVAVDLVNSIFSIGQYNLLSHINEESVIYVIKNLLLISSLLSLIIGTVVGLAQNQIKRLLAYSTISHIGFILLALAINTEQSIDSLLFYIIQYTITNLNIFLIIIAFSYMLNKNSFNYRNKEVSIIDIKYISDLKGQFTSNPLLSLSLTICLFSMAGIPPLMGFFSKQFVLYSAMQSGFYFISIIAILTSVISASYYLKIIRVLHTSNEDHEEEEEIINNSSNNSTTSSNNGGEVILTISNFHSFLISTLTLSILLFLFKPSLILNSTQLLSLTLFNL